jgi:hypothetical protein
MSIIKALNIKLKATASITDIVSTRIWYKVLPQNPTYPALTFFEVDDLRYQTHDQTVGLSHARFQFDAWAETKDEVETLIEAIVDLWAPWRGSVDLVGTSPLQTVYIDACLFQGLYEPSFDFESEPTLHDLFRKTADFIIWYR